MFLCFNVFMRCTIVGLGNPGEEYTHTRHNVGWMVLEHFRNTHGLTEWEKDAKRTALVSTGEVSGVPVELVLPETFMNNSGAALKAAQYRAHPETIILVHDELDLPFGSLRIAWNRGSAGHKGVRSVIAALGTKAFTRLRIGISPVDAGGTIRKPRGAEEVSRFVLKKFTPSEREKMAEVIERAGDALGTLLIEGKGEAKETDRA